MPPLNRRTVRELTRGPAAPTLGPLEPFPERVVQFGEGNFLRAFADWMLNALNARGLFRGRAVVVQPIPRGLVDALNEQDGLYTLLLRGLQGGQVVERREIITAVSRGIDPYRDWRAVRALAGQPDLRVAVSNTTEAGIAYVEEPRPGAAVPASFPAKVAAFLAERFAQLGGTPRSGLIFLPCELIDRNGEQLRACVLRHAAAWDLGAEFARWVAEDNRFLNTLVDRIVPGYPHEEAGRLAGELGYDDRLLTTGEVFHVWVIEGDERIAAELPFVEAGLNVVWTDDLQPYRTRKVRILNGAHTMLALAAYLGGLDTVRQAAEDPVFGPFLRRGVFDEILPVLALPEAEKRAFAGDVLERLANPFIRHNLLSIALNSVAKYRVRVLPSLLEHRAAFDRLPAALTFSLAALLAFYRGTELRDGGLAAARAGRSYLAQDDVPVLAAFAEAWRRHETDGDPGRVVDALLSRRDFWDEDLRAVPGLADQVTRDVSDILRLGVREALAPRMQSVG
jgi:tagaturonate reductase